MSGTDESIEVRSRVRSGATGRHASTVTTEAGAWQVLGQLADTSVSQTSKDHAAESISQQGAKGAARTLDIFEGSYGAEKTL
ncbi:hypothetical protein VTL71DRAFT_7312 [Oculimacula yallundae]|uniref:Uncharacterized protein n=1 Tax=Oculimacula yallundae TaxID=86028 RepID=A0ABR4BWB5_9HELO